MLFVLILVNMTVYTLTPLLKYMLISVRINAEREEIKQVQNDTKLPDICTINQDVKSN